MDTFAEQLVYKYPSSKDNAKKFLIYAVAVILAFITIILTLPTWLGGFGLVLAGGIAWLGYFLGTKQYIEYEYIITNGEIDIDKIVAKSKRTRLITVKVSDFTAYGPLTDDVQDDDNLTLVLASENTGVDDWYADFDNDAYGKTRLIFTPNSQFKECINPYLKNGLRLKKNS